MSGKLAGGLSDASKEALKELVAMGDTSVPGVEASDINDGDIMANTRERVNSAGQFQFVYIPPDGSDNIESDWIQQDHKKKVILGWCEGVKSALISRGQAGMRAANEAAMEAKLKAQREEQMSDETEDNKETIPAVVQSPISKKTTTAPTARSANSRDPTTYVEDQLDIARERLQAAESAQQDIIREVLAARRDHAKWTALASALGGIGDSNIRTVGNDNLHDSAAGSESSTSGSTGGTLRLAERTKPGIQVMCKS